MIVARTALAGTVAGAVLLAACGGGGGSEADKSVDQIKADVQAALRSVKSFHIEATLTSEGTVSKFKLDSSGTGRLSGSVTLGTASAQLIIADGNAYVKGKELIAALASPEIAQTIDDHYLKIPVDQLGGLGQLADASTFATCLFDVNGTLSKGNSVTVGGHAAIELKDAGDKPGSQPGVLDVQTDGPAYPLHFQTTGVRKAGGNARKECGGPSNTDVNQQAVADLSGFGESVSVTVPTDVVGG